MNQGTYERTWDSVQAMVDDCDRAHRSGRKHNVGSLRDARQVGRKFWDWSDVLRAVKLPWEEGLSHLQQMKDQLEQVTLPQPTDRRRRRVRSADTGDDIDFDRLRGGQDDYWWQGVRQRVAATQHVTIVTNITANAGVSHKQILWRGAAGLVLCDLLEQQGYSVELWVCNHSTGTYQNKDGSFFSTRLKEEGRPVDLADLVSAVSGWFFRSVFFQAFYVRTDAVPRGGLGWRTSITSETPQAKALGGPHSTLIVIDGVWSCSQAVAKVKHQVESLNTPNKGE